MGHFKHELTGLSLRFQVAGYLLLVAGEVASSHGASATSTFLPNGATAPKQQSSSRVQLSLAVLR